MRENAWYWARSFGKRVVQGSLLLCQPTKHPAEYAFGYSALRGLHGLIALYSRLAGRGKPHSVALIACAQKLLIYANTVVQHQKPWTEKTSPI